MGKTLNFFQINIFFGFIISEILLWVQKDILDNIIFFNNTNGDIYLTTDNNKYQLFFGTTSANGDERILFGLCHDIYSQTKYIIMINDNYVPYIRKKIGRADKKEIPNAKMVLVDLASNPMILLVGTDNSYMEMINLNSNIDDEVFGFEQSEIIHSNIINKGISPLLFFINGKVYYLSTSILNDDPSYYYITLHEFIFQVEDNSIERLRFFNQNFNNDIKGTYMSCDSNNGFQEFFLTCFYLDIDNNYTITFITTNDYGNYNFSTNKTYKIAPGPINGEFYFVKALSGYTKTRYAIYAYYSGEMNHIPTLRILNIDDNYNITNKFDNFTEIYLGGFNFNNGIKYNDVCLRDIKEKGLDLYFISANDNREILIISYIKFYYTSKMELVIRYQKLELKKYFNLKIFHGFKALIFGLNYFLNIAFDFCFS